MLLSTHFPNCQTNISKDVIYIAIFLQLQDIFNPWRIQIIFQYSFGATQVSPVCLNLCMFDILCIPNYLLRSEHFLTAIHLVQTTIKLISLSVSLLFVFAAIIVVVVVINTILFRLISASFLLTIILSMDIEHASAASVLIQPCH